METRKKVEYIKIYVPEKLQRNRRLCLISQFLDSQTAKGKYENHLGFAKKVIYSKL
jgi:hypothetical protein